MDSTIQLVDEKGRSSKLKPILKFFESKCKSIETQYIESTVIEPQSIFEQKYPIELTQNYHNEIDLEKKMQEEPLTALIAERICNDISQKEKLESEFRNNYLKRLKNWKDNVLSILKPLGIKQSYR